VLLGLGPQVINLHVAVVIGGDDDDFHAGQRRAGRVRAVGAGGDEADVAVALAAGDLVGTDGQHAGVLALRAAVGLQRAAGEAGDLG